MSFWFDSLASDRNQCFFGNQLVGGQTGCGVERRKVRNKTPPYLDDPTSRISTCNQRVSVDLLMCGRAFIAAAKLTKSGMDGFYFQRASCCYHTQSNGEVLMSSMSVLPVRRWREYMNSTSTTGGWICGYTTWNYLEGVQPEPRLLPRCLIWSRW